MTRKTRLKSKVTPFAEILSAVGDVNRLAIIYTLAQRPMDVREIIDITGIPGSLMTHHLNTLFRVGWVKKRKYGKRVEYTLVLKNRNVLENLLGDTFMWKEQVGEKNTNAEGSTE